MVLMLCIFGSGLRIRKVNMGAKKLLFLAIVAVLVSSVNLSAAFALPLWQYGMENQSYTEFKTVEGGSFENQNVVSFGNVDINSPVLISGNNNAGYLYTQNPFPQYSHVTTATVESLTFNFTLQNDYSQLELAYGRFGSEIDYLFFDGVEIFSLDGTAEGEWDLFVLSILGEIHAGDHSLTLAYGGGDDANGHYIDFIRLENGILADYSENGNVAPVPEPATVLLLGTGLLSIVGLGRKRIKR